MTALTAENISTINFKKTNPKQQRWSAAMKKWVSVSVNSVTTPTGAPSPSVLPSNPPLEATLFVITYCLETLSTTSTERP